MSKKKNRIDTSGASSQSFGNDAFSGLNLGADLPAGPAIESIHESKASRLEKKLKKKRQIRLDIKREKSGRGGKTVSVVYGTSKLPAHEQKELLISLKKKLATGGTQGKDTIEIQGDFVDRVVDAVQSLGYTAVKAGG